MYYGNSIQDSTMGNQQETSKIRVPQRLHVKLLSQKKIVEDIVRSIVKAIAIAYFVSM